MWITNAWTVVVAFFAIPSILATESQYDYPACVVRPEHEPKYYCVITGQQHIVYKQYNLPRNGPYESYYKNGWKQPRRINWETNLASMSMYQPDAPDFIFGEQNQMCRIQEQLVLDRFQNKSVLVSTQQCSFPPKDGDTRFIWNNSLVVPGLNDPTIFMTSKSNPRNNNATFPIGSSVISLAEYVTDGRFDEKRATDPIGKCPTIGFVGKYRITTGMEVPLVVLYSLYIVLFLLLIVWTIVRGTKNQSKEQKTVPEQNSIVLDMRLLEARGGPTTPVVSKPISKQEEIIQQGFKYSFLGQFVFIYFIVATLGLNLLLIILILDNTGYFKTTRYAGLFDPFAIIIYIWVPLWFCTSVWLALTIIYKEKMKNFFYSLSSLNEAQYVRLFKPESSQILLNDTISQWVGSIETWVTRTLFGGTVTEGYAVTVPVQTTGNGIRFVEFQHLRYSYDVECQKFRPSVIDIPTNYDQLSEYKNGLTSTDHHSRLDVIGRNAIKVEMPTMWRSIRDEVFVFFYIYQLVCYYVWYFTDYTWVAALNTIVIVSAASINIYTTRSMLASVVHMTNYQTNTNVYRDQSWKLVDASELVPGDLIQISENWIVPCDIIVLKGSTVCDESMLTGESMPVQKTAIIESSSKTKEKKHFLYAGTKTLSSGRQEEILGVVYATGAQTSRGQLIQSILFPITLRFKYDQHLKAMVGFLFLLAILSAYFAMSYLIGNAGMANTLFSFVYGMFMFSAVLNPLLPVVITIGQVMASKRLLEKKVFCLNPHRITLAGKVRLFCFDKTGTITKQGLDYRGVVPVSNGIFCPETSTPQEWIEVAMATCHGVGTVDGNLVGNEVEVKMLQATGWTLKEMTGETPCLESPTGTSGWKVVKRFDFDHHRMSQSVVMEELSTKQLVVFCKGSYEKIETLCTRTSIPADYKNVAQEYAKQGCYVLGMSFKVLETMSEDALSAFLSDRDAVEANLTFLSLLLFRNELKTDSKQAILTLKQGDVRCVMITGDNAMTGCYIARASGMIETNTSVLIGDVTTDGVVIWKDLDTSEVLSTNQMMERLQSKQYEYELAVTGPAFDALVASKSITSILFQIRIFARMTPQGKVDCVQLFMSNGVVTGMCGDGGNDCGALRIAHVGVALSEAEASVVSPFTSQLKTLESVVEIIIEGRGALATSFASVKYLILYGCIGIGIRLVMYKNSVFISQFGFMFLDGAISTGMAYAITRARPLTRLGTQRPTSSLLGPTTLCSIFGQTVLHVLFLYLGVSYVMQQPWYCPFDPTGVNLVQWWYLQDSHLGSSLFILGCFQQTVGGLTSSIGSKFRRSISHNTFLMGYYIVLMIFVSILWLGPPSRLTDQFRMSSSTNVITLPDIPTPFSFRWELFCLGVVNTIVVIAFEWIIVLGPVRDYFRRKYHKDHLQLKM